MIDGIKWFKSNNNVILTPGNQEGFLISKYFKKVILNGEKLIERTN